MNEHYGSCLCGSVKFQVSGSFDSFYLCHCTYCQKDTGSAHAANLFSSTAKLIWLAGEKNVNSFTLTGTRHSKSFCRQCGSALPNTQEGNKLVVVPAGSLDSQSALQPTAHIFTSSKADWENSLQATPRFEALPK